jgi:hypothetical protein
MRSARTSGLMLHLSMHPENGLGCIVPRQFVAESMHFSRSGKTVDQRRSDSEPISDYLWGRGHSWIPAPAELMYQGDGLGMRVKKVTYDDDLNLVVEHTPLPDQMISNVFSFTVGRPEFVGVRKMLQENSKVSRVRTFASDALENARIRTMRLAKYDEGLATGNLDGNWFNSPENNESESLHDKTQVPIHKAGEVVETKSDPVEIIRHDRAVNPKTADKVTVIDRGRGVSGIVASFEEKTAGDGVDTSLPPGQ